MIFGLSAKLYKTKKEKVPTSRALFLFWVLPDFPITPIEIKDRSVGKCDRIIVFY